MLVPALGFVILVLVIALVVMMLRKPKTNTITSVCPSTPSGGSDGIFGIPFTRGENEVLDFLDNVENRSSETLRHVLCTIVSDQQLAKLVAGNNQKISCKEATARLDKITVMVQSRVQKMTFKSEAVKTVANAFVEELVSVYKTMKVRLCKNDDDIIESETIVAIVKDARTKFCKNSKTLELKPIFEDITRVRSGKLA